ncbi:MAG: type II 3-dehydroquinate dehydratase [Candidatus Bipolaricaulia bacterium]
MTRILIVHGPNLNLLGDRDPGVYGSKTLEQINADLHDQAHDMGLETRFFQSNHEGELIDCLHRERHWAAGVIINPGALTHYSYALRDAVEAIGRPTVEVHLSDIRSREPFRRVSVLEDVCIAQMSGQGAQSYSEALEQLRNEVS